MAESNSTLEKFFKSYRDYVSQNPQLTSDIETSVKWISYILAARIDDSSVWSELVYSLSNLLVLFNDRIIAKSRNLASPTITSAETLKTWLTVLEYSEVFIELSCYKVFGKRGKWAIILSTQILKCLARLRLLLAHKENIVESPLIRPLNRNNLGTEQTNRRVEKKDAGFRLKSGKVIRSLSSAADPRNAHFSGPRPVVNGGIPQSSNAVLYEDKALLGEILYILKPIVHLSTLIAVGNKKSWKPYITSFVFDALSIYLIRSSTDPRQLTVNQKVELSQRTISLLMYLLRSPFYDKYTKARLNRLLLSLANSIPLFSTLLKPLAEYIPKWQETYFYMWSN
nr:PREDICTED: peroxisomal membrane protein PEX16 [Bemisia tabaci]